MMTFTKFNEFSYASTASQGFFSTWYAVHLGRKKKKNSGNVI